MEKMEKTIRAIIQAVYDKYEECGYEEPTLFVEFDGEVFSILINTEKPHVEEEQFCMMLKDIKSKLANDLMIKPTGEDERFEDYLTIYLEPYEWEGT